METHSARLASFEAVHPITKKRTSHAKGAKPIRWPHVTPSAAQVIITLRVYRLVLTIIAFKSWFLFYPNSSFARQCHLLPVSERLGWMGAQRQPNSGALELFSGLWLGREYWSRASSGGWKLGGRRSYVCEDGRGTQVDICWYVASRRQEGLDL